MGALRKFAATLAMSTALHAGAGLNLLGEKSKGPEQQIIEAEQEDWVKMITPKVYTFTVNFKPGESAMVKFGFRW